MRFLVHITCGAEDPTRAALGFLVARTAQEEGHDVTVFLAGEGVTLITDDVIDRLEGVGTGSLGDHFEAFAGGGGRVYLSGMSSKARGIGQDALAGKPAEMAMPPVLVKLIADSDRVVTY